MIAEVISIGTELASGQNLDTNTQWLSRRLSEAGITVAYHTTVVDDLAANVLVLRNAVNRAQLVVITGGLGPTADDLTREALAQVADVELVLDQPSLDFIEGLFRSRNRTMPERNRIQAYFPEGSKIIANPRGTAPGIWMEVDGAVLVAMPGVPREMFPMFEEWALPRIKERFGGGRAIVSRVIRCFGAGESQVEEMLGDLTRRGRQPEVGITASAATISLRINSIADTPEEAAAAADVDARFVYERLGTLAFGEGDDELQDIVARLLHEKGKTLATAESCTGGLVGHWLTEVPGVSENYLGGVIAYSNEAKARFLDVPRDLLETKGAVSPEVAEAMALGARARFGSDLAIAITGIAGPGGGTPEKPVGLVYVCLAHAEGTRGAKFIWGMERSLIKVGSAKMALNLVRVHLLAATT